MDYSFEDYYEPSEYEIVANEFASRMKELLKEDIKSYFDNILKENERLKKLNAELKEREYEVIAKEEELENKLKNLERDFYRAKFKDILKDIVYKGYEIHCIAKEQEKCNLCDENRKIKYFSPLGKSIKVDCDCSKRIDFYFPVEVDLYQINIIKSNNPDKLWVRVKYCSDEYASRELDLETAKVIKKFNDDVKNKYYYGLVYLNKEECQKHCDYLNNKSKMRDSVFNYDSKNDIMYIIFKDDICFAEEPYTGFVVRLNENDEVCGFTILDWMKQNKVELFSDIINYYKEQINLCKNIIEKLEQVRIKL